MKKFKELFNGINWSQHTFVLLALALVLVAAVAVKFTVLDLNRDLRQQKEEQLTREERQLADLEDRASFIARVRAELDTLRRSYARYQDLMPTSRQLPALMQLITDTAEKRKVAVVSTVSRPPEKTPDAACYRQFIDLELRCRYSALLNYLQDLRELPRLVHVNNIRVEPAKSGSSVLRVNLVLEVFIADLTPEEL